MRNEGGSQIVNEGQFGFARDARTSPALLPRDPGLNLVPLPFAAGVKGGPQSAVEDCVVR
jgi:hypothetical protein